MQFFDIRPIRLAGGIFVAMLTFGVVHAKDDGTDPSVTIEKEIQSNVIQADGSFDLTVDMVWLINEERGIKAFAQRPLNYNRLLENLDVVEAYTQKPDGRKVVVQPDQIKDQQERQSSDAPMFQDTRVKVIIFPEVAIGDRLVLQYIRHRTTALFPGQFEDLSYRSAFPHRQFTLSYNVPEEMTLYADARGYVASTPAAAHGRKIYQWDYVPDEKARVEQGSVSYLDYGHYLAVSTFADYGAFARAYDLRAKDKSGATPKITELAHAIVGKISDPRAQAFALDDWVRKNIRYVAVYIGAGGVVPHSAETILDNRYGDCKDHVVLLEALLSATGIDSTPALIDAGNAYTLPKAPTLGVLNHVITYIPKLDIYLDSTADSVAAGYLPILELGKPVVLTKTMKVVNIPASQKGVIESETVFNVNTTGAADFTQTMTTTGWASEMNRYAMRNMKPTDRDFVIQRLLTMNRLTGSGVMDAGKLDGAGDEYEYKMSGHAENLVNFPGPIGVPTLSSFAGGIAQSVFSAIAEKERTQDFLCFSQEVNEQVRFDFPKEISIVAIPKPVSLHDAHFDYTSDYKQDVTSITVHRHYKAHYKGAVCSPDDFKNMKPTLDAMARDVKSQIIVQGT